MKRNNWTFFLLLTLTTGLNKTNALAQDNGDIIGNGGDALVCQESGQTKTYFLDWYDAVQTHKSPIDLGPDHLSVWEKIQWSISKVSLLDPARAKTWLTRAKTLHDMIENKILLGVDHPDALYTYTDLPDLPDSGYYYLPANCIPKQVFVQDKNPTRFSKAIIMQVNIYKAFDKDNRALSILHETAWQDFRSAGWKTSQRLREYLKVINAPTNNLERCEYVAYLGGLNFENYNWGLATVDPRKIAEAGCKNGSPLQKVMAKSVQISELPKEITFNSKFYLSSDGILEIDLSGLKLKTFKVYAQPNSKLEWSANNGEEIQFISGVETDKSKFEIDPDTNSITVTNAYKVPSYAKVSFRTDSNQVVLSRQGSNPVTSEILEDHKVLWNDLFDCVRDILQSKTTNNSEYIESHRFIYNALSSVSTKDRNEIQNEIQACKQLRGETRKPRSQYRWRDRDIHGEWMKIPELVNKIRSANSIQIIKYLAFGYSQLLDCKGIISSFGAGALLDLSLYFGRLKCHRQDGISAIFAGVGGNIGFGLGAALDISKVKGSGKLFRSTPKGFTVNPGNIGFVTVGGPSISYVSDGQNSEILDPVYSTKNQVQVGSAFIGGGGIGLRVRPIGTGSMSFRIQKQLENDFSHLYPIMIQREFSPE